MSVLLQNSLTFLQSILSYWSRPSKNHKRLINVCKTRWVARIDGLSVFIEVFPAIVKCFQIIRDNVGDKWNSESVRKAGPLYLATVSFSFIVALVVVLRCLQVTRSLTVQLQELAMDAGAAREKLTGLYVHLEKMRNDLDVRRRIDWKQRWKHPRSTKNDREAATLHQYTS